MLRPLALPLAAGMALLTVSLNGAAETFPVIHNEPVTVRILGGKDGLPLAHLHLVVLGGYDQKDLHDQLFRAEVLTDSHGQAKLPMQIANLPWLQVWVATKPLCQAKPRGESFSVELIRRDGLSAPNRCGTAVVEDAPGVFTVFVKGKVKNAVADKLVAKAEAQTPAPVVVATALPAAKASLPAVQLPAAPAPVLTEKVLKPAETVRPVAAVPATVPAPSPAAIAAKDPANGSAKAAARPVSRVAARPVSHRARPVLASSQARHRAASENREGKPATAIDATNKTKPSAGVKMTATTPRKPKGSPKQE